MNESLQGFNLGIKYPTAMGLVSDMHTADVSKEEVEPIDDEEEVDDNEDDHETDLDSDENIADSDVDADTDGDGDSEDEDKEDGDEDDLMDDDKEDSEDDETDSDSEIKDSKIKVDAKKLESKQPKKVCAPCKGMKGIKKESFDLIFADEAGRTYSHDKVNVRDGYDELKDSLTRMNNFKN